MELGELITALEAEDPAKVLPHGFANPHSYRGYYEQLAFEPASNVTVAAMLTDARSAVGAEYQGYKGGDFTMDERTDCWLASWGACGEEIGPTMLRLMLAAGTVSAEPTEPPAGPLTVYASIGNSDDKLAQAEWALYVRRFKNMIDAWTTGTHGIWCSLPDAPYQNMCICFEITPHGAQILRGQLAQLAADYRQDSIAWAEVTDTRFITPGDVPAKPKIGPVAEDETMQAVDRG